MNRSMTRTLMAATLLLSGNASAGEIVRWVDSEGVTHFTERYLAQAPATTVDVQPANGMDVPDASSVASSQRGPVFKKISRPGKKNKDGWTGYNKRDRSKQRSRRYR